MLGKYSISACEMIGFFFGFFFKFGIRHADFSSRRAMELILSWYTEWLPVGLSRAVLKPSHPASSSCWGEGGLFGQSKEKED
ncbi:hypothetical protein LY76DRAFT_233899 [Colletotrichum caudatum]|nr:hypothetical protein LY76DRAFT_233899 [Colletotrichum caudatum]